MSGNDNWWTRFAQATTANACIPCPECDHRHDCWFCKMTFRLQTKCDSTPALIDHPAAESARTISDTDVEAVRGRFSQEQLAAWAADAAEVAASPDTTSDSTKLRAVAAFIDVDDARHGRTGSEAQDFLRDLADRLERAGQ
jgi:hypothetical protein